MGLLIIIVILFSKMMYVLCTVSFIIQKFELLNVNNAKAKLTLQIKTSSLMLTRKMKDKHQLVYEWT